MQGSERSQSESADIVGLALLRDVLGVGRRDRTYESNVSSARHTLLGRLPIFNGHFLL